MSGSIEHFYEMAMQLSLREGQACWRYHVAEEPPIEVASEFVDFLGPFLQTQAVLIDASIGVEGTVLTIRGTRSVCVLAGFEPWSQGDWSAFERLRSFFVEQQQPRLLVLQPGALGALLEHAPHTASLFENILGRKWSPDEGLRKQRMDAYEAMFGMTGEEAIRQAERGNILADPGFGVWLCLLGRGDLLVGP